MSTSTPLSSSSTRPARPASLSSSICQPTPPHGPYHDVPQELYEKYKAKDLTPVLLGNRRQADTVARIFAMDENIDQNVGRLFDKLRSCKLTENTDRHLHGR